MKIFACSDAHESFSFLKKIRSNLINIKPDLIIFAGDFLNFGSNQEYTIDLLDVFEEANARIIAISGNADSADTSLILEKKGISIENRTIEIEQEIFAGFSTDPSKPFEPGFSIENAVVVSHQPITAPTKKLAGGPRIWIAGHLHRYWVESKFGTTYVHLPAANLLKAVLIDSQTTKCRIINIS